MKQLFSLIFSLYAFSAYAQNDSLYLLKPDRVFDGEVMHKDWVVLVKPTRGLSSYRGPPYCQA